MSHWKLTTVGAVLVAGALPFACAARQSDTEPYGVPPARDINRGEPLGCETEGAYFPPKSGREAKKEELGPYVFPRSHWILLGMREPSLVEGVPEGHEVYRSLYIPTFSPAVSVRVVKVPHQPALLIAKRLRGPGGYRIGPVEKERVAVLDQAQWHRVQQAFSQIDEWKSVPNVYGESGFDGSKLLVERVKDGQYSAAAYHNPDFGSAVWDGSGLLFHLARIHEGQPPRHRVSVTTSLLHLFWPFFEVTSEWEQPGGLGLALVSGGGTRSGAWATRFGAQGRYYLKKTRREGYGAGVGAAWTGLLLTRPHDDPGTHPTNNDLAFVTPLGSLEMARYYGRSYVTTSAFAFANQQLGHLHFEIPLTVALDTYVGPTSRHAAARGPKVRIFAFFDIKVGWGDEWLSPPPKSRLCPPRSPRKKRMSTQLGQSAL